MKFNRPLFNSLLNMQPFQHQRGMALMTMIFLLVVIGSSLTFMARLSQQQNTTNNLAVMGARAKWAAMAGLNWAAYKIDQTPDCPTSPTSFTLSEKDLNNFTLTITCTENNYVEGASNVSIFLVVSRAEYGSLGDPDYAFRELEVVMEEKSL
jgi:MSHA biogenesis protein MshP